MKACVGALLWFFVSCSPLAYRLDRFEGQLRLVPPRGTAPRRAPALAEAHRLRYGPYARDGFVDLSPGLVLKAVSPVVPAGELLSNEIQSAKLGEVAVKSNVIGFATVYYRLEEAGGRIRIRFRDGEEVTRGVAKPLSNPPVEINGRPAHWRLYFLTRESGDDRDITLVGAASKAELDRATMGLGAACRQPEISCVRAPRGVAFSAQVEFEYNGQPTLRPLGTTVGEVIRGNHGEAAPEIQVERRWRGKLVAVRAGSAADLRGLQIHSGDRIRSSMEAR